MVASNDGFEGTPTQETVSPTTSPDQQPSIGKVVTKKYNLTLRTLRFYESKNLLHANRKVHRRFYRLKDYQCLEMILHGMRLGFPHPVISELPKQHEGQPPIAENED